MKQIASGIPKVPGELKRLADAACNGTLTTAQCERLEQLLRGDKASQVAYVSYLDIHAQLLWEGRSGPVIQHHLPAEQPESLAPTHHECGALPASTRRRSSITAVRRRVWWAALGVAAAVLIAAVGFGVYQLWPSEVIVEVPAVATWVRGVNADWTDAERAPKTDSLRQGDPLPAGVYSMTRGRAEIRFERGALVTLEAPVTIELIDRQTGRLLAGRLVAAVPPDAAGFAIHTPATQIIDRGTEFGVAVDETGATFVQAYEGRVQAVATDGESGSPSITRRVWPLTAMHILADGSIGSHESPFEPTRFVRRCPAHGELELPPARTARVSLEASPDATAHVRAFVTKVETAPAEVVRVGATYENFVEVNDFTKSELIALIPALLELLDDQRPLAPPAGQSDSSVRRRVADRAESVLEFVAGYRPAGEPRPMAWRDWWAGAQDGSRSAWLAGRTNMLREQLARWRAGAGYPENLHALNMLEIAARSRDRAVVPILMDTLGAELPAAHETEISLAAVLQCIGQLGEPGLVTELVELARQLNSEQTAFRPAGYSEPHVRRSSTLRAFVAALDRLSGTQLASGALRTIGPGEYLMCAIDEVAFERWLEAAKLRGGEPDHRSPSDRPNSGAARSEAS
jgi:hypothetical protein